MSSAVNETTNHASATATPATPVGVMRLRGLSRGIGYFWQGISYVFLSLVNAEIFAQRPALLTHPRGWAQGL